MTVSAGSISSSTLKIVGGLLRQVYVRANTDTTVFKVDLQDERSTIRRAYDFHEGELNDVGFAMPVQGQYTISITNVSPNDTFKIVLAIQE